MPILIPKILIKAFPINHQCLFSSGVACTNRRYQAVGTENDFSAFGEAYANVPGAYDKNHRIGGGVSGGVVANVTNNWKWLLSSGYLGYPLGDHSDDVKLSVGQRFNFAKNFAFRTTYTHHDRDNEISAIVHGYF